MHMEAYASIHQNEHESVFQYTSKHMKVPIF